MGMTIELDGSAVGFGQIHLHSGGDIRVGPFLLRVLPTPIGAEDVSIDIERAEDDAAAEKVDVRSFALASVMPGKRPMAWVLAALVLALFLAWPIWSFYQGRTEAARYAQAYHADRMWLSGSLSQGHASLERQLPGLPCRAVRPGPRRRLQGLPHRHPRPCRPAPARRGRARISAASGRLQHDDRRLVRPRPGPLRRLPHRA